MCGISGIYNYGIDEKVEVEDLERLNQVLSHRGPDDCGYFVDHCVGLGHRRLSIIDLSTGHQPIYNEDKTIVLVCNGEIYNYQMLRELLFSRGHQFYTKSDTEVIIHLYEEFGEEFVKELRGMFALALWDDKRKKLVLARDRLGIKPLFYSIDQQRLIFGSEIKSIVNHPSYPKRIDYEALHDYLSFMTTTGSKTIFEGVNRLLPAELLICEGGNIEKRIYWETAKQYSAKRIVSIKEFEEYLLDAVRSHLVSDVPVGAFLSGGLDSSAIVALMSKIMNQPVKTFSIGFSGSQYYDETPFARKVAEHFKTDHHEIFIEPDVIDVIPKMIDHFDEPYAVSSALPTYFLAKHAREKVKVVLTGDGADELMAGYHYRYLAIKHSVLFDKFPFLKRMPLRQILQLFMPGKKNKISKFLDGLDAPNEFRYFRYLTKFQEDEKVSLYSKDLKAEISQFDSGRHFSHYYQQCPDGDGLNKWLYVDLKTSLPDEMLTKVDRMTMAFGLEARVPFLDHLLVEFVNALSSKEKLRGRTPKYLLRKVMAKVLPKEILSRGKHGFEVPIDEWIRGDLKDYTKSYLNRERIKREGFFNGETVERLLNLHWEEKFNYGHQIWILLMFGVWYEKHFK